MARIGVTQFLDSLDGDLRILVDIETDLLVILDEFGDILRVNPAFEKRLGYTEAEVLRHDVIRYVAIDDLAQFLHSFDFDSKHPVIRLLRRQHGYLPARLIAYRFKEARGYLVFRPVERRDTPDWMVGVNWNS